MDFIDTILDIYCSCMQVTNQADPVVSIEIRFDCGNKREQGTAVLHSRNELEYFLCSALEQQWSNIQLLGFRIGD